MGKLTTNERSSIIDDLINNTSDWTDDEREVLEGLPDKALRSIVANAIIAEEGANVTNNEEDEDFEVDDPGDEDDEDDDEEEEPTTNQRRRTVVSNSGRRRQSLAVNCAEEYLNNAPEGPIREGLRDIVANYRSEKKLLINTLSRLPNCPWDKSELVQMENRELRNLAKIAGVGSRPVYNGANVGEFSLTDNNIIEEKPLPRQTLDFSKKAN